MEKITLLVTTDDAGQRLDKFLSYKLPELSRTRIQSLIQEGCLDVTPNRRLAASIKIINEEIYTLIIPDAIDALPQAQDIPLNIVYEDDDLIVVNKPAGMVVHPAPGHKQGTLVNALLGYLGNTLSGIGGVKRPGIVHRLDKETSGLMVIAKNDSAHQGLAAQFHDRQLSRTYTALVWGLPKPRQGTITSLIGRSSTNRQKMAVVTHNGRESVTHYKVISQYEKGSGLSYISQVQCQLATGRTHQIRVHMHHIGCPIIGDPIYGRSPRHSHKYWPESVTQFPRQALHAQELKFIYPRSQELLYFSSQLPDDLVDLLKTIETF